VLAMAMANNADIIPAATRGWQCRINPDGLPEWTPTGWVDRTRTPLINTRIRGGLTARKHARRGTPSRT
jgi:hypothetical protein